MRRLLPCMTWFSNVEKDLWEVIWKLMIVWMIDDSQWGSKKCFWSSVVKFLNVKSSAKIVLDPVVNFYVLKLHEDIMNFVFVGDFAFVKVRIEILNELRENGRGVLRLQKSWVWEIQKCRATLRHVRRIFGTIEMPQWRARTWLQLMCCTLSLELGVLILEWVRKVWWSREQSLRSNECRNKYLLRGKWG